VIGMYSIAPRMTNHASSASKCGNYESPGRAGRIPS
jgi:hypothetical protein